MFEARVTCPDLSWKESGYVTCPRNFPKVSQKSSANFLSISRKCSGHFQDISLTFCFLDFSWKFTGHVPDSSGMFLNCSCHVLGKLQMTTAYQTESGTF